MVGVIVALAILVVGFALFSFFAAERLDQERAFRRTFVTHETVDAKFRKLAELAAEACESETSALNEAKRLGLSPEEREGHVANQTRRVSDTKDRFWRAVGEARALGYLVPKKMGDALKPESPETSPPSASGGGTESKN